MTLKLRANLNKNTSLFSSNGSDRSTNKKMTNYRIILEPSNKFFGSAAKGQVCFLGSHIKKNV